MYYRLLKKVSKKILAFYDDIEIYITPFRCYMNFDIDHYFKRICIVLELLAVVGRVILISSPNAPWLHYGYCTPYLEVARVDNTESITEHITQCEALSGQC